MRVYFDASIIITAIISSTGGSAQLFKLIKLGLIKGITSHTVVQEVLEEDKPKKIKKSRQEIEEFIAQSKLIVRKMVTVNEITPYRDLVDVKDAHIIAGANLTKCEYLVTLDKKHLLRSYIKEKFLPLLIVSPKKLLEEIITKY